MTKGFIAQLPAFVVLCLGLFAVEEVIARTSQEWRGCLSSEFRANLQFAEASVQFNEDWDLDLKGCWLRPTQRGHEKRIREFRKQVLIGLVTMLNEVERKRPSLTVGVGQCGLVTALASSRLIMETACRARAATPM